MLPDNTTSGAQSGETHVISPDATGGVGNGTQSSAVKPAIELVELNRRLGKNFPDMETALKSIEDTNSYVGRKKEDIEKEVLAKLQNTEATDKLTKQIEDLRKDNFFRDNSQYAKPEIRALIDRFGGDPAQVVQDASFKAVFEKVKGYEEAQNLRTVLDSNPRLATSRDAISKVKESVDKTGRRSESDELEIANALLSSLE